jgi:hypothetical protein
MSKALISFEQAIGDAEELLNCYDKLNEPESSLNPPEVLKRASLIMTLTAWETYVEDIATEMFNDKFGIIIGSHLGNVIEKKFYERLKVFNNPDSVKTKQLFVEFFGVDVTEAWVWNSYKTPKETSTVLNEWAKKRGEAVHRAQPDKSLTHIAKRTELDKCIRFFKELVEITDKTLMSI